MSENLISENENTVSETPTAEIVAIGQTTNAADDAAKIEESAAAAVATNALVKIEGQEFPLDVSIVDDDDLLRAALSPHYPSIKNPGITR